MRRLTAHAGLKVLSVALALVLWFMVAGQKEAERSLRVGLEFQNIPEALELVGEPPSFVDVRVRGSARTIAQLRGGDLLVLMDLGSARAGRRLFQLASDNVTAPTGVRVLHVVPATVALTFEASITRTVPVSPVVEGTPAPGYARGRVTARAAEVRVAGPESVIRALESATTEPVSIEGARGRVRDTVTIGLPDPTARLVEGRDAVVTVEVLPAPIERTVPDVPVAVRNLDRGRQGQLATPTVTVTVRGAGNVVRHLSPQSVPAFVDVSGLQPGQYNLPVRIDATPDYTATTVVPAQVRVRIR